MKKDMNNLQTAVQLVLEFLESPQWGTTPYMDVRVYEDAAKLRNALRAALAQPALEPVVWECKVGGLMKLTQRQYDIQSDDIKRWYTRIESRPIADARAPTADGGGD